MNEPFWTSVLFIIAATCFLSFFCWLAFTDNDCPENYVYIDTNNVIGCVAEEMAPDLLSGQSGVK